MNHSFELLVMCLVLTGLYTAEMRAGHQSANDKEFEMKPANFGKAKKPPWLGSKAGVTDEVMPPWTPLTVSENAVSCWGRTYEFDDSPLPSKITTAGESILASPITLEATVAGKPVKWSRRNVSRSDKSDSKVALKCSAKSDSIELGGDVLVEYDGMMKIDITLTASAETTLDNLTLRVPLRTDRATLYHFWPGRWGSAYNSGAVPNDGMSIPFKPFVWMGYEEGGLAWFAESDEGWTNKDKSKVIEVARENGSTVLNVRFVDAPRTINGPLRYTFGLQSTPVKPIPNDWREWRVCHGAYYGMESNPMQLSANLTYPAEGNINLTQGTLEAWVIPMFDPQVEVDQKISRGLYNRELFMLRLPNNQVASVYWNIDDRGMRFYVRKGKKFPIVMGSHSDWNRGEPHHIAFSWGKEARIYVDGKLLASRPFNGLLGDGNDQPLESAELFFGGGRCDFIVDEIRISDISRETFDLSRECSDDEHTLLLDHLNDSFKPDGDEQTGAAKISADSGEKGGLPSAGGSFVAAKFGNGFQLFQSGSSQTALDRAQKLGVKTLIYHESWTDIQNYTETTHKEKLKRLVAECHKRGIKLLLYFGYEMSNIAPEWPLYSEECLVKLPGTPVNPKGGYHRAPEQRAYKVCYNSHWQDFLADGVKRLVDEYGIDGVYLDGTIEPWGCQNYLHGCGYKRADGSYGLTYPIFAVRNLMKRLYRICVVDRGGFVNPHQSTCCVIPTLSFSTSYWDGEQFGGGQLGGDPLKMLPLAAFRAEFMGKNWGVPAEFLVYPKPPDWTVGAALSFTMLHDVRVRPCGVGSALEKMSEIWSVMTDFGVADAEWRPYWRNEHLVKASPEGVMVSLYNRKGKGVLLVVSNLGKEATTAKVELNLSQLGLAGKKLSARDAISKERLDLVGAALKIPVPRLRMRMALVK